MNLRVFFTSTADSLTLKHSIYVKQKGIIGNINHGYKYIVGKLNAHIVVFAWKIKRHLTENICLMDNRNIN